jgi:SM-20-related protein
MEIARGSDPRALAKSLAPMRGFLQRPSPYLIFRQFLGEELICSLLEHARANESKFKVTKVGEGNDRRVDPSARISKGLRDIGKSGPAIEAKILSLLPKTANSLGIPPFEAAGVELELVAHGEGAFFKRHVDSPSHMSGRRRMISGVYYFHAQPRIFKGGALRLHAIEGGAFVDIEPHNDTLAVFPSWALHEVLAVNCPSGRFIDSRFAINCWVLGPA